MKLLEIDDNELVTLPDYPIHDFKGGNKVIIKLYFRIFQKGCGNIIPRVAVIHKDLIISTFTDEVKSRYITFENNNPQIQYIALEGNHRMTAASLTKSKIPAMLFETDQDCKNAQDLFFSGEIFREYKNSTLKEYYNEMNYLFSKSQRFYTAREKTKMMVDDAEINLPQYMKNSFNS